MLDLWTRQGKSSRRAKWVFCVGFFPLQKNCLDAWLRLLKLTTRMAERGRPKVRLGMRGPRLDRRAVGLAGSQPVSGGVASQPESGGDREPGELQIVRSQPESGGGASQPESGGENTSSCKRPSSHSSELLAPASKKKITSKQKASQERARVYQVKKMLGAPSGATVHTKVIKRRAPGTIIALALVKFIGVHLRDGRFPLMIRMFWLRRSCVPGFPAESGSGIVFAGAALLRPAVDKIETFASAPSVQRTR